MWIMAHGKGRVSSVSHNVRCKVDLPLIRELLTDEEYAELLRRMVLPNGPLLDYKQAFGEEEVNVPNAAQNALGQMNSRAEVLVPLRPQRIWIEHPPALDHPPDGLRVLDVL